MRWKTDTGGALVEMALVIPLLVLLCLGVADFGRAFYHGITFSHAARAGAAYGSQSNGHTGDTAGIRLAAEQEAQNILPISVASQRVCECSDGTTVACTTANCAGYGAPRASVRVTTSQIFTTLIPYPGIPSLVPLARTAKVRVQ
jgi:Flp pilus assembly protein TadG